jgi:glycosyltransferase involved in cell wall biosynthesis
MSLNVAGPPSSHLLKALSAVAHEPRLTAVLQHARDLQVAATLSLQPHEDARLLVNMLRIGDAMSSIAAIHALSAVADPLADETLLALVVENEEPFAGHAAWALAARSPVASAVLPLVRLVLGGGFSAMLAERTLVEWSRTDSGRSMSQTTDQREALSPIGLSLLNALPTALAVGTTPNSAPPVKRRRQRNAARDAAKGIVVVQPYLHARLDRSGSLLGSGDAGGIASLLRSLGTSLAALDNIDEVITVTRRQGSEARTEHLAPGHRLERIDFGPDGMLPWREAWVYRTEIERGFMELGESLADRQVVWHLRMADVGTLAASAAAQRLGQPVVFTAAPDPHIVIDALQDSGRLDRSRFAMEDAAAQYWFRSRMVERLVAQADRIALFPRPTIEHELIELIGVDPDELAAKSSIIAEGVDVVAVEQASDRLAATGPSTEVQRILRSMPEDRRHLPWVLSVGRLNPSKGPQRIVDAVVSNPGVADLVNIVIVGGDIVHPSPDEQSTIERIQRGAVGAHDGLVTLAGHLPPDAVCDVMAYASSIGSIYVAASDKEEFGLAIVEALASGLVVVAPERGGPQTYVVEGDNGVLCNTLKNDELRSAIDQARSLVGKPGRRDRAVAMVRRELSIERMALQLRDVYRELVPSEVTV